MSEKRDPAAKGVMLVVGAYIITLIATILAIVLATMIFIDTTKCSSVSQALPGLWVTIAIIFLTSLIVVSIRARNISPSTTGRWVILGVYGVLMLISFVVLAFFLLIIFNC